MPHVMVKVVEGKSEEAKARLARKIVDDVTECFGNGEDEISVSIEEFPKARWKEAVYDPEIVGRSDILYKKPGYEL
ncbi:tautomerase family protein [Pararhizobium mangrovi]|uniref:4-oxalocrotonate tautomerase n=1 Tax=Pararhizobium mangrovi TaxID=2590452 RepID=A0A506UFS2_9HYPH|nr:tautomerase family protein [Pararhizobium mangrovi]TPW31964.1 4-oxalocrotonate tautomerase [Pararhizobium mangrovi]